MNASQRRVASLTIAALGVLCIVKALAGVYVPAQDMLILHVSARYDWDHLSMGWLLGGIALLGGAGLIARGE